MNPFLFIVIIACAFIGAGVAMLFCWWFLVAIATLMAKSMDRFAYFRYQRKARRDRFYRP